MKIALIGGGNVYALSLARHLDSLGIEHFGIGRSPRKHPAFWQVEHEYRYYQLHLIREFDSVLSLLDAERPDVVVNYAAQGESAASFGDDTHYFYATNTLALVRFAEALARRDYLQRFIQAGTSECYGSTDRPARETDPLMPTSPYAVSKAAFDQHLQIMHRVRGFPVNVLRPSNAYCPGQQLHRIIPRTIVCALAGRRLQLQGGGWAQKSYMDATDLSRAVLAVIESGKEGRVYNCGPDKPVKIRDLVEFIADAAGVRFDRLVEEVPARVGEDARYWLDSTSIKRDTGWHPVGGLVQGIGTMVDWVRSNPDLLAMDPTYRIAA